jgi:THAP domain
MFNCRCQRWFINTRRDDLKWPADRSRIKKLALCENHFNEHQYMNPADKFCVRPRKRLRHDAVPTVFDLPPSASLPTSVQSNRRRLVRCQPSTPSESKLTSRTSISMLGVALEDQPQASCSSSMLTGDRLESVVPHNCADDS